MRSTDFNTNIVLVAMADSIHVARWISQFPATGYKFFLFPSTPNRRVHPDIVRMKAEHGNIEIYPFGGRLSLPLWGIDLLFGNLVRSAFLQALIKRVKPDFVHALEFQHGAYLADQALRRGQMTETFIATNYGSDIYWFQQFPKHLNRIKSVLARADRYSAECTRDVQLALNYGFNGQVLPVIPNAGGIAEKYAQMEVLPPNERKLIMIKGYDGWVGRATLAVDALPLIKDQLAGYEIVFYSCNGKTLRAVKKMSRESGINVTAYPKRWLSHPEMMGMFSKALIYVGVSLSDGISTSMLEALTMGAYPVQTATACTSEWFSPGIQGTEIRAFTIREVSQAISAGIHAASTRTHADLLEITLASRARTDSDVIAGQALVFYK